MAEKKNKQWYLDHLPEVSRFAKAGKRGATLKKLKKFYELKQKGTVKDTDTDALEGTRRTGLTKQSAQGTAAPQGSITMNTGGGEPISAGKKWEDEPEKKRVEQPRSASSGQFTFNSLAGLDKKDKRDRAKGTGDFGEDPALTKDSTGIGEEYLKRKKAGEGLHKGEVIKLKNGDSVVVTRNLSVESFYKYFMTHYKDKSGEIRNALLENGLLVKAGSAEAKSKYITHMSSWKKQKFMSEAADQWRNFTQEFARSKGIMPNEAFAKTVGDFVQKHPSAPRAAYKGQPASPNYVPTQPKVSASVATSKTSAPVGKEAQAVQLAKTNPTQLHKLYGTYIEAFAKAAGMTSSEVVKMIADGDLKISDII